MTGNQNTGHNAPGIKLTYDDFVRFPDDGQQHELIGGEHYVTASPNTRHQRISMNLILTLGQWVEERGLGRLYHAPLDVVLSSIDVVEPDLLYIPNDRADAVVTPQHVRGTPDLVIEIGSPTTRERDETIKRRLYERVGVTEYWFVDPEGDLLRVYRRAGERFAPPIELELEAGDVLTSPLLPGLELPLSLVFRD